MTTPTPMAIRGWQFHHRDPAYLERAVERAAADGINHVQLSHNIVHFIDQVLEEDDLPPLINRVTERCHAHGMRTYLWTHELQGVPAGLRREGKVDLDEQALWDWLREKYRQAFARVPDIDGLILTFHETETSVYKDELVFSSRPHAARVTQLIDAVQAICAAAGKSLYVRTFVYRPDELAWVTDGISAAHPDVRVMTKCVPHDWHPFYPHNPAIGRYPERIQLVELDPAAEYYGQSFVPFNQVDYMQYRLRHAAKMGAGGAVIRVDRLNHPILGTVNEVNLAGFAALAQDVEADMDAVWRQWTRQRYGPVAGPGAERALRRTFEIITGVYLTLKFYFLNGRSGVPTRDYADALIAHHSIGKWDAEYQALEDELLRPTPETCRRVEEEKARAVALARQSLQDVDTVQDGLTPAQYLELRAPLEKLYRLARLFEGFCSAYMRARVLQSLPRQENVRQAYAALERAEHVAGRIELECGSDRVHYENVQQTRALLAELRTAVQGMAAGGSAD